MIEGFSYNFTTRMSLHERQEVNREKIISILKNMSPASRCRTWYANKTLASSIYRWKSKFGGMEVSDAKRQLTIDIAIRKLLNGGGR